MEINLTIPSEIGTTFPFKTDSFNPDERIDVNQKWDTKKSPEYDVDERIIIDNMGDIDYSETNEDVSASEGMPFDPDERIAQNQEWGAEKSPEYDVDERIIIDNIDDIDYSEINENLSAPERIPFDPDERINVSQNEFSKILSEYNTNKTVKTTNENSVESESNVNQKETTSIEKDSPHDVNESKGDGYLSTYKERVDQTPRDDGERGKWEGERGESKFIPNDEEISEILSQYNLDGIEYKDGIPDFSKCSECTVEIDNMTENRRSNFEQCDEKCAEQWNKERRDGRDDWTARDVQKWREENGYSWHERNDMKTCDLVPTKINDYFGHLGGVGECRRRDTHTDFGGEFDE